MYLSRGISSISLVQFAAQFLAKLWQIKVQVVSILFVTLMHCGLRPKNALATPFGQQVFNYKITLTSFTATAGVVRHVQKNYVCHPQRAVIATYTHELATIDGNAV